VIAFDHNSPRVTEALKQWRSREIFPTEFSSIDIRGLSRELRMRSVFSARTTNAEYLEAVARVIDDMLSGKINMATGRWHLMKKLKELGYDPATGFPQDMAHVPPSELGSLCDLSSRTRLDLMLETNQRISANYGRVVTGNTEYARYNYPAWELVRLFIRKVPRGTPESHSAGWEQRWRDAGEVCGWEGSLPSAGGSSNSPMIALKDSPIWTELGAGAGGYTDTLDNPFPPFAFNSGKAWRAVPRAECIELGLIERDEVPGEMKAELTPGEKEVNAVFKRLSPDLQAELRRELAA
jgi:hypothetical protein